MTVFDFFLCLCFLCFLCFFTKCFGEPVIEDVILLTLSPLVRTSLFISSQLTRPFELFPGFKICSSSKLLLSPEFSSLLLAAGFSIPMFGADPDLDLLFLSLLDLLRDLLLDLELFSRFFSILLLLFDLLSDPLRDLLFLTLLDLEVSTDLLLDLDRLIFFPDFTRDLSLDLLLDLEYLDL